MAGSFLMTVASPFRAPLTGSAWGLVGRIAVAIAVYALLWSVGSAMHRVVRPEGQRT